MIINYKGYELEGTFKEIEKEILEIDALIKFEELINQFNELTEYGTINKTEENKELARYLLQFIKFNLIALERRFYTQNITIKLGTFLGYYV